jgi:hypothetical protein
MLGSEEDFSKEIKTIRHGWMLNEYPQEFVDSIIKPSRSNYPSYTIYQGTVIIPYVKGITDKLRHIGNHFNVRIIFKTEHVLCGTLTKTGLVRDAQQRRQMETESNL